MRLRAPPRAGEIRRCAQLRELSLEANRLSAPVIDLRALAHLRSLQLFGNPLEFLPELTPCSSLRHLSLANVRSTGHLSNNFLCIGQPASGFWCRCMQEIRGLCPSHETASPLGPVFAFTLKGLHDA